MTAVRIDEPGALRLLDEPVGDPGHGEARVRIAYAGICGSDREVLEGGRPAPFVRYPVIPGHEWSGVVDAVGPGVDGALVARKVVGEGFRNCQVCDACRRGDTNLCRAPYDETGFTQPGAWNDQLLIPARLLHGLADDADLRAAALLEPSACVAEAVLKAAPVAGERCAIVGDGTLGLLAAQLVRLASPAELVVIGPRPDREELALRFGAHRFADPYVQIDPFDVVIEAAGAPGTAQDAVSRARRGGRVVLTGIPSDPADPISAQGLMTSALTVSTVFGASSRAWVHIVRAFTAGLFDPLPLVTHELPLTEIEEAFRLLPTAGKILLRTG